jgi:hypothetical protein
MVILARLKILTLHRRRRRGTAGRRFFMVRQVVGTGMTLAGNAVSATLPSDPPASLVTELDRGAKIRTTLVPESLGAFQRN